MNKMDFIKSFLPEKTTEMKYVQIDLDATDLSIGDILRNINRAFPLNTKERNKIASGEKVVVTMLTSELLDPLQGIIIIICEDARDINLISQNYMILAISETFICSNNGIQTTLDRIATYLCQYYKDSVYKFKELYAKYIYDEDEQNNEIVL